MSRPTPGPYTSVSETLTEQEQEAKLTPAESRRATNTAPRGQEERTEPGKGLHSAIMNSNFPLNTDL